MKRLCVLSLMLLTIAVQDAMGNDVVAEADSTSSDGNWLVRTIKKIVYEFDNTDDDYIEPPHYEFAVEFRAARNYESFILSSNQQSIMFAPDQPIKFGPYFGWRWIFLGTTFDLKNISLTGNGAKREIDFSLYSSPIGVDLYYRRTGSDYKLRDVQIGSDIDGNQYEGMPFDGITVGITGANIYYIFNHRRFSYPAAFSPASCQKISCGSWMAGAGYTKNTLDLDFNKLESLLQSQTDKNTEIKLDSGMMFNFIEYNDFNLSVGYAYTWVLLKNLIFCASGQAALAYKSSYGKMVDETDGFSFGKVNLDGIGRFALVYNNTRWYAGASAVLRTNNYHTSRFTASNIYGTFNIYAGYNFILRKRYKKK